MKTLRLPVFIMMTGFGIVQAQTSITLTFTATLDGAHNPLDSVYIRNLTQAGDTTLYGNDTLLLLQQTNGVADQSHQASEGLILQPAFPNPFNGTTTIEFYLAQQELVTLGLYDLWGREVARLDDLFPAGGHRFTVHPGNGRLYFLSVETPRFREVQKLIPVGGSNGGCRIEYTGWQPGPNGMKKDKAIFPWTPGDNLRFIGYTSNGADTIDAQPVQSTQYTFQYASGTCPPTVTDINGNVYSTVQIGTQCWMKENLKTRNYKNGTAILNVTENTIWKILSTGARCWYNNDSASYAVKYGALYNFYAVDDTNGLCPTGWHVPSDTEWAILVNFLGGENIAGGHLKETGNMHWESPNTGATNSSGFTALPGGFRSFNDGNFINIGYEGSWQSSTAFSATNAWRRKMIYYNGKVDNGNYEKTYGYSVRCVKD